MQKIFGFLFLFAAAPVCMGFLYTRWMGKEGKRPANIYLSGFLTELAVFQLIAVPVMILEPRGMKYLVPGASAAYALLSVAGLLLAFAGARPTGLSGGGLKEGFRGRNAARRPVKKTAGGLSSLSLECRLFWLIALAAIAFQVYMAYAYAVFDGDDSYYVVQSVIADQTGVLNRIRPYTGLSTDLDIRHALASLPLWEAYVARMTGIHATIVAHTLLPLVLIPLTYLCYFQIGRKLLGAANVKLPVFMTLVSIMQIWGNTSIYTNATFFLMRTWQGKSVMSNLVLLVLLWLLLELMDVKKGGSQKSFWALLVITNVTAAMMTSMGAFLAAMLIGITGLVAAVRQKKPSILVKFTVCCIPNVVYLVMLLVMG